MSRRSKKILIDYTHLFPIKFPTRIADYLIEGQLTSEELEERFVFLGRENVCRLAKLCIRSDKRPGLYRRLRDLSKKCQSKPVLPILKTVQDYIANPDLFAPVLDEGRFAPARVRSTEANYLHVEVLTPQFVTMTFSMPVEPGPWLFTKEDINYFINNLDYAACLLTIGSDPGTGSSPIFVHDYENKKDKALQILAWEHLSIRERTLEEE